MREAWVRIKQLKYWSDCMKAYKYLLKLKSDNNRAIFVTSYAIGDLVYAMSYIKAWKDQNPEYQVVVIADPKKKDIVESYTGYDEVVYMDRKSIEGYRVLVRLNGSRYYSFKGREENIFNLIPIQVYGYKTGKDCLTLLRNYLRLKDDSDIYYPKPNMDFKIKAIEHFESIKDRVVIVNPYSSGKLNSDCKEVLERLVQKLQSKNYIVYTNVIGRQQPLANTKPLNCSLLELYKISNEIPMVVSERSGIMDWIISSKSKKVVLYPDMGNNLLDNKSFKDMFCMLKWKTGNCREFFLYERDAESICKEVIEYLEEKENEC